MEALSRARFAGGVAEAREPGTAPATTEGAATAARRRDLAGLEALSVKAARFHFLLSVWVFTAASSCGP
eukprot:6378096-Prorocentrum_lima.AAC.1